MTSTSPVSRPLTPRIHTPATVPTVAASTPAANPAAGAADTMKDRMVQPVAAVASAAKSSETMPVIAGRMDEKTGEFVYDRILKGGIDEAKKDLAKGQRLQVSVGFYATGQSALFVTPVNPPGKREVALDMVVSHYSPGTENTYLFGTAPTGSKRPQTGYMAVGRVTALGPDTEDAGLKVGDLVAVNVGHVSTINVSLDHGWNHMTKVPEALLQTPEVATYISQMGPICLNVAEIGARAFLERALEKGDAASLDTLRSDKPLTNKRMVLYGAGPVGIVTAIMLRSLGAEVAITDRDTNRLQMAQDFGFTAFNNNPDAVVTDPKWPGIDAADWVKSNWGSVSGTVNCAAGRGAYSALESALSLPQEDGCAMVLNPTFHQGEVDGLGLGKSYHHRGLRHLSLDKRATDAELADYVALAKDTGIAATDTSTRRASAAIRQASRSLSSREAAASPDAAEMKLPAASEALQGKSVKVMGNGEEALLLAAMAKRAGAKDVAVYGLSAEKEEAARAMGCLVLSEATRPGWNEKDPEKIKDWRGDIAFHCGESYGTLEAAFDALAPQASAIDLGTYEGLEKVEPFYGGDKEFVEISTQILNRLEGRTLPKQAADSARVFAEGETPKLVNEYLITHRLAAENAQADFFSKVVAGQGYDFVGVTFWHTPVN